MTETQSSAGFTLVELLVVLLILGILAAIALPAFFSQDEKAGDAKAKEYAHTAEVAIETYGSENEGSFKKATPAKLLVIEPGLANASITVPTAQETKYKITSKSDSGHEFSIENNAGVFAFTCKPKDSGGCPANKKWGE